MFSSNKQKLLYASLLFVLVISIVIAINHHHSRSRTIKSSTLLTEMLSEGDQIRLGSASAPQTLTVFYDYSCSICRRFFFNTLPKLQDELNAKRLTILLKPVNLNGDHIRNEAYLLLYCLENYGLFDQMHKILLLEPDYMYNPEFMQFKETLFYENIDIQQCTEHLTQLKYIEENKALLNKFGYSALPLYILGNKALPGHQSAEKIKSLTSKMSQKKAIFAR